MKSRVSVCLGHPFVIRRDELLFLQQFHAEADPLDRMLFDHFPVHQNDTDSRIALHALHAEAFPGPGRRENNRRNENGQQDRYNKPSPVAHREEDHGEDERNDGPSRLRQEGGSDRRDEAQGEQGLQRPVVLFEKLVHGKQGGENSDEPHVVGGHFEETEAPAVAQALRKGMAQDRVIIDNGSDGKEGRRGDDDPGQGVEAFL